MVRKFVRRLFPVHAARRAGRTGACTGIDRLEPRVILRLEDTLCEQFEGQAIILKTDRDLLQIMHPEVGKAAALAKVAKWYGIPMEQVMAIGDAPNDVGMLQVAGVSVAMDNAHRLVKDVADWVAPSNNDHGVHAALAQYGLC